MYTKTPGHVYVGQTSDFQKRMVQHRSWKAAVFIKRYGFSHAFKVPGMKEKELCISIKKVHPDWVVCGAGWTSAPYTPL